ncbi:hypothetical protein RI367_005523 [Sorochytrium milnesiophthora]
MTAPKRRPWQEKRQVDDKGFTLMTLPYLQQLCKDQGGYNTPELNDKVYLHFKGFSRIENIERFTGLKSLWLEGNAISAIENIDELAELRCLFLQENCIEELTGLSKLSHLSTLNVSNNMLRSLGRELALLPSLSTLQAANNKLSSAQDIDVLRECTSLTVLDLANNMLGDPDVMDVIHSIPQLAVLNLMGNEVIRKVQQYRRNLIVTVKTLTYLDDRPIFDSERKATEAWAAGGVDAERNERQRQRDQERDEQRRNFEALRRLQEEHHAARRSNGEDLDAEAVLPPHIQRFRDDMLRRIDSPDAEAQTAVGAEEEEAEDDGAVPDLDTMSNVPEPATSEREEDDTYANSAPIRQYGTIDSSGKSAAESEADIEDIKVDNAGSSVLDQVSGSLQSGAANDLAAEDEEHDAGFLLRELRSKKPQQDQTPQVGNSRSPIPIEEIPSTIDDNAPADRVRRVLIEELDASTQPEQSIAIKPEPADEFVMPLAPALNSSSKRPRPLSIDVPPPAAPTTFANAFTGKGSPGTLPLPSPRILEEELPRAPPCTPTNGDFSASPFFARPPGAARAGIPAELDEELFLPKAPPSTPIGGEFSLGPMSPVSAATASLSDSVAQSTTNTTASRSAMSTGSRLRQALVLSDAEDSDDEDATANNDQAQLTMSSAPLDIDLGGDDAKQTASGNEIETVELVEQDRHAAHGGAGQAWK